MEEEWDYLCSELGILEDKAKKNLIRRFVNEKVGAERVKGRKEGYRWALQWVLDDRPYIDEIRERLRIRKPAPRIES